MSTRDKYLKKKKMFLNLNTKLHCEINVYCSKRTYFHPHINKQALSIACIIKIFIYFRLLLFRIPVEYESINGKVKL